MAACLPRVTPDAALSGGQEVRLYKHAELGETGLGLDRCDLAVAMYLDGDLIQKGAPNHRDKTWTNETRSGMSRK